MRRDIFARSGQLCRCGALLEGTSVGRWLFLQTFLLVEGMRTARCLKQTLLFNEREKAQPFPEEVKGNIWGVSSCYDWRIKFPFGVQKVASSPSVVPTGCSLRYQTCLAQISLQVSQFCHIWTCRRQRLRTKMQQRSHEPHQEQRHYTYSWKRLGASDQSLKENEFSHGLIMLCVVVT